MHGARRLLGENNEHLGKIVGALCKILAKGAKEGLADPDTWQKIVTIVQQMNSRLPAPVRLACFCLPLEAQLV